MATEANTSAPSGSVSLTSIAEPNSALPQQSKTRHPLPWNPLVTAASDPGISIKAPSSDLPQPPGRKRRSLPSSNRDVTAASPSGVGRATYQLKKKVERPKEGSIMALILPHAASIIADRNSGNNWKHAAEKIENADNIKGEGLTFKVLYHAVRDFGTRYLEKKPAGQYALKAEHATPQKQSMNGKLLSLFQENPSIFDSQLPSQKQLERIQIEKPEAFTQLRDSSLRSFVKQYLTIQAHHESLLENC
jgi:hypothetical protein